MNYYPHHIGDYTRDTAHLSMLEDSAYRRLLDVYYSTEKPLTLDARALYRLVRARSKAETASVDVVLSEFFNKQEDGWHNKRADEEIAKAQEKSRKARDSAASRWGSDGNANAMRTHSEGNANPITNNQEPNKHLAGADAPAVATAPPDCPHEALLTLYHEVLPDCPRVLEWNDTRQGYMRARWREKAKPNGRTPGYSDVEGGIQFWRGFFEYVAQSDFLTGKAEGKNGKPPFVADLEWLIRPTNFAKVVEGRYHR